MSKKITFTKLGHNYVHITPKPAKNFIPDWYTETKDFTNENVGPTLNFDKSLMLNTTIKKCVPVQDAINLGYIIVSETDLYVDINDLGEQIFSWPTGFGVDFHLFEQAEKHPKSKNNQNFPRWIFPWTIKTPKGYSCLIVPPMHRDNVFEILPGVIDTDYYSFNITLPFVIKDKNFKGIIPKNTPVAQIIPFKRENWKIEEGNKKDIKYHDDTRYKLESLFLDKYKRMFWKRKSYD